MVANPEDRFSRDGAYLFSIPIEGYDLFSVALPTHLIYFFDFKEKMFQ